MPHRILRGAETTPDGPANSRGKESSGMFVCLAHYGIPFNYTSPSACLHLPSCTCRMTPSAVSCARVRMAGNRLPCRATPFVCRLLRVGRPWPTTVTHRPPTKRSVVAACATRASSFACDPRLASTRCQVSYRSCNGFRERPKTITAVNMAN